MARQMIDFADVKRRISIEEVAERLGLTLEQRNHQLRGPCPICGDENPRVFCITPKKGAWYCFAHQKGGDCISLVSEVKQLAVREAAEWLVGTPATAPEERPHKAQKSGEKSGEGFKPLPYLEAEHEAVEAIGLCPVDAGEIGIGYAKRGAGKGSVMIPIRLSCGTLIGYVGCQELTFVPKEWHYPEGA